MEIIKSFLVLSLLFDHLTKLPVVQTVISVRIKPRKGFLNLFLVHFFADLLKFLKNRKIRQICLLHYLDKRWSIWSFFETNPSPSLSICLKSVSIAVSSPIISEKESRPSKSLSMVLKKISTSSLVAFIPAILSRFSHSSGVSFPSPLISAWLNSWRTWTMI